jgi:SAM-dependent methyltransferase
MSPRYNLFSLQKKHVLQKFRNLLFPLKNISEKKFLQTIYDGMNQNGSSLYDLLVVFRCLRKYISLIGENITNQRVLEIGSSKHLGLPLILLLAGCRHYSASNVFPVDKSIERSQIDLLYLIMSALLDIDKTRLDEILIQSERDKKTIFHPDFYSDLSPTPAEQITVASDSMDGVFSISVLEHVTNPEKVLQNTFRMLKPGGWFCHTIDLRDHSDFTQPLAFLKYSAEEYKTKTAATENRLRATNLSGLFKKIGLTIEQMRIQDRPPILKNTYRSDVAASMLQDFNNIAPRRSIDEIEPWVTEEYRASLHPDFQSNSLKDLSALVLVVLGHKPLIKGPPSDYLSANSTIN